MKQKIISGVRLSSIACAVPRRIVKQSDERLASMVGVRERRHVQEQSLLELAHVASHKALNSIALPASMVDAIVFVTQSQERRLPSAACELQHALGIEDPIPVFDVGLACSGYTYGLWIASSLRLPRVLLVVGDTISRFLDPADAATYP